jgi:hypothetical protein
LESLSFNYFEPALDCSAEVAGIPVLFAACRVGIEPMGIDPGWAGYLVCSARIGLAPYDIRKIDVRGDSIASAVTKYRSHADIGRQLRWHGPIEELQSSALVQNIGTPPL